MNQKYFEEWEKQGCREDKYGSAKFRVNQKDVRQPNQSSTYSAEYVGGVVWKLKKQKENK